MPNTVVEEIKEFPGEMRDALHSEIRKLQNAGYAARPVRIKGGNGNPGCWGVAFRPIDRKEHKDEVD